MSIRPPLSVARLTRPNSQDDEAPDPSNAFRVEATQTLKAIELLQPLTQPRFTSSSPQTEDIETPKLSQATTFEALTPASFADEDSDSEDESITSSMKPLYIQQHSSTVDEPVTVLIACETCSRSDFPTIHSLLSHARMSHGILYRSHEELVGRCGRIVAGTEAARIRKHGTEASSRILLGMRTVIEQGVREAESGHPNALARTLGLHIDSPALASFLGKEPQVHSIRVYESAGDLDVEAVDDSPSLKSFLMIRKDATRSSHQRRKLQGKFKEEISLDSVRPNFGNDLFEDETDFSIAASRFHIKRRLVVTDSSFFVANSKPLHQSQPSLAGRARS